MFDLIKVKKSGMPPGPRAGFSMCVHKKRALLFGGVVDMEMEGWFLLISSSLIPSASFRVELVIKLLPDFEEVVRLRVCISTYTKFEKAILSVLVPCLCMNKFV